MNGPSSGWEIWLPESFKAIDRVQANISPFIYKHALPRNSQPAAAKAAVIVRVLSCVGVGLAWRMQKTVQHVLQLCKPTGLQNAHAF